MSRNSILSFFPSDNSTKTPRDPSLITFHPSLSHIQTKVTLIQLLSKHPPARPFCPPFRSPLSPPFQPAFQPPRHHTPPLPASASLAFPIFLLSPLFLALPHFPAFSDITPHLILSLISSLPPLSPLYSHFSFFLLPPFPVSLVSQALPTLSFSPEPCRLVSPTGSVARREPITSGEAKVPWLVPGWLFARRACYKKRPFCSLPSLSMTAKARPWHSTPVSAARQPYFPSAARPNYAFSVHADVFPASAGQNLLFSVPASSLSASTGPDLPFLGPANIVSASVGPNLPFFVPANIVSASVGPNLPFFVPANILLLLRDRNCRFGAR